MEADIKNGLHLFYEESEHVKLLIISNKLSLLDDFIHCLYFLLRQSRSGS